MDFDDLNNLKLPHSIECACGERARYIGEDRGITAEKIALCVECYETKKNLWRDSGELSSGSEDCIKQV